MRFFLYGIRLPFGLRGGISTSPREIQRSIGGAKAPQCAGRMRPEAVYVIATDSGLFKIGVSADPESRMAQLQTGNPHKLRIVYVCWLAADAFSVESFAHDILRRFNVGGEWFRCAEPEAINAVNAAATYFGKQIVEAQPKRGLGLGLLFYWAIILFFGGAMLLSIISEFTK